MKITLCTDLDRTLLPNGLQISDPQAIPLLHRITQEYNINLIYVTGRSKKLVLDAIQEYDLPIPQHAITDVGTRIYRITPNTSSSDFNWDEDDKFRIYLEKNWDAKIIGSLKNKIESHPHISLQEPEKQSQFKLSYYLDTQFYESNIEQDIKHLTQDLGLRCNIIKSHDETTETGLLDIIPGDASKYHAIRFLMDEYIITTKEIVFCGDSGNDMEVLVSEIPAVLVKNTQDSVKKLAQQLVQKNQIGSQLYIAKGDFCGLNGNYCSGILEGLAYYFSEFERPICEYMKANQESR